MKKGIILAVMFFVILASAVSAKIGGGEITYDVKHIGKVVFNHDTHVETIGFSCTTCHPYAFESREKHKQYTMTHKRQARSCGECHNGKDAFDLKSNCYVCHQKGVK